MEPIIKEQLTELTEQELVNTEGGLFGIGLLNLAVLCSKGGPGSGPGKTPNPNVPRL